jgi:hypothetical protein
MIPLGTGPGIEPIEHPLIMVEPKVPWQVSGWLLILFGVLSGMMWVADADPVGGGVGAFIDDTFLVGITVSLTLFVCGILILRRVKVASWVVLGVLILNALLVPFLPGNSGRTEFLGDDMVWAFMGAVCQGMICGGVALIPVIFGLKKGEEGRF